MNQLQKFIFSQYIKATQAHWTNGYISTALQKTKKTSGNYNGIFICNKKKNIYIYIYICVCVCDTGKVQQNVPRARYFSFLQKCCQSQVFPMPQGCIKGSCLYISPWTRKQKSFHMSRRVSLVNPTASYSTTPLCSQNRVILIIDNIIV